MNIATHTRPTQQSLLSGWAVVALSILYATLCEERKKPSTQGKRALSGRGGGAYKELAHLHSVGKFLEYICTDQ